LINSQTKAYFIKRQHSTAQNGAYMEAGLITVSSAYVCLRYNWSIGGGNTGLVLTCSDTQSVQWWTEMCSDEKPFCSDESWRKKSHT